MSWFLEILLFHDNSGSSFSYQNSKENFEFCVQCLCLTIGCMQKDRCLLIFEDLVTLQYC
jgi:hypothetical protein